MVIYDKWELCAEWHVHYTKVLAYTHRKEKLAALLAFIISKIFLKTLNKFPTVLQRWECTFALFQKALCTMHRTILKQK